jgi:hypothetical protein
LKFGWWRSPVAHLYGVQGVASSNLVHPTRLNKAAEMLPCLFLSLSEMLFRRGIGASAILSNSNSTISLFRNKINEAIVAPSGTSPVSGDIVSRVTIDPTVQTAGGIPYVQRHYDIEPATNPATSTATITLYFTQQEFDNYNAHPAHGTDLPGSPTDNNYQNNRSGRKIQSAISTEMQRIRLLLRR